MMAGGEEKAGGESCSFHRQRRDSRWKPRAAGWLDEGTRPATLLIPSSVVLRRSAAEVRTAGR
jgi:hypothetical protein